MATSSSRNYVNTCNEITLMAMDLVGVRNQGTATLNQEVLDNRELLNVVMQSISVREVRLGWTLERRTALYVSDVLQNVVTSGSSTYDLATDVLDVLAGTVWRRPSGGSDVILLPMSHEEYAREGSKSLAGPPTRYLLEASQSYTDSGNSRVIQGRLRIVLHPVPNNSTDVIGYTCIKKLQDFDAQTNDPDAPPTWMRCVVYGLAAELAIKYGLGLDERRDIRQEFLAELERVRHHDTQRGSMILTPRFPGGWL